MTLKPCTDSGCDCHADRVVSMEEARLMPMIFGMGMGYTDIDDGAGSRLLTWTLDTSSLRPGADPANLTDDDMLDASVTHLISEEALAAFVSIMLTQLGPDFMKQVVTSTFGSAQVEVFEAQRDEVVAFMKARGMEPPLPKEA